MADTETRVVAISRTVYGTYLQTVKTLGLQFTLQENTTLNERLDVQARVAPNANQVPSMTYIALGNRGHTTVIADDGSEETVPIPHRADDAAPYGLIPIALREPNNDFTAERRDDFALRLEETHNGREYIAYYLMRIDMAQVVAGLNRVQVIDNIATTTPFVPTTANLNPKPPRIDNQGVVIGSDSNISASAVMNIDLSSDTVAEIVNAHRIRTGSTRSPVLSEIALCSGVDKVVTGRSGTSGSFSYNEVIACQVNVFVSTHHALGYTNEGTFITLDVGGVEPMLGESDMTNATFLTT